MLGFLIENMQLKVEYRKQAFPFSDELIFKFSNCHGTFALQL